MKIRAQESTGFEKPHIPEGLHHAEFISVNSAPDGKFGERVALEFDVYYMRDKKPVRIGRIYGKKLTPKSQLWEALNSIGADLKVGQEIDIGALSGYKCRVMVEDYRDSDGRIVSGISKVKPAIQDTISFIEYTKKETGHRTGQDSSSTPT